MPRWSLSVAPDRAIIMRHPCGGKHTHRPTLCLKRTTSLSLLTFETVSRGEELVVASARGKAKEETDARRGDLSPLHLSAQ